MTGAAPQSPAMPRGRYWHVKAYWRALKGLAFGMAIWVTLYHSSASRTIAFGFGLHPIHERETAMVMKDQFPLLLDAAYSPLYQTFYESFARILSSEPLQAILFGGLICTVVVEKRLRRREAF